MGYLRAMSGTPVETPAPSPGSAQAPIYPLEIGANGAWRAVRSGPQDGSCGVHGYPCQHPGVDVVGPAGTVVVAPESGTIVAATDGASAPYVGYGPWAVIIQGDSGKFHLLGHLDPFSAGMAPLGGRVAGGQIVGATSSADHTHWEVRSKMVPDFASGEDNLTNNVDPLGWLAAAALGLGSVLVVGGVAILGWLLLRRRS